MYGRLIILRVYLHFVFTDKYWSNDAYNRRNFFIEFATQKGFDPLVAVNWENIQLKEIPKQVREKNSRKEQREREKDLKSKTGWIWPTELL